MTPKGNKQLVIYQAPSGAIELRGDFNKETIWATQAQIADLFSIERSVATKHIRNILKDKELNSNSVCANFAHTADDGKIYQVQFYNLDLILAVGYRANSSRAIEFRQWATKTLREHITKGYTVNRKRIAQNYDAFIKAVADVQALLLLFGFYANTAPREATTSIRRV
ncbi:MAG: RhuM family protein [bacterium]|nr:RhuM family protein [bacterium]